MGNLQKVNMELVHRHRAPSSYKQHLVLPPHRPSPQFHSPPVSACQLLCSPVCLLVLPTKGRQHVLFDIRKQRLAQSLDIDTEVCCMNKQMVIDLIYIVCLPKLPSLSIIISLIGKNHLYDF